MESPLEEEVRKAAKDIYEEKNENGIEVNNPEKSIVRKSLEDIEADIADIDTGEELEEDTLEKMELDAGGGEEKPDIDGEEGTDHLFSGRERSVEEDFNTREPESGDLKKMERYDYSLEDDIDGDSSSGFIDRIKSAFSSSGSGIEVPETDSHLVDEEEKETREASRPEEKTRERNRRESDREENEARTESREEETEQTSDGGGGIQDELESFEEKIVENESEELGKINELEKRVEKLEMDDSLESIEKKIYELEEKVEENNPEMVLDRVDEIHQILKKPENHLEDLVNQAVRKNVEDNSDSINELRSILEDIESQVKVNEAEIERLGREQERVSDEVRDLKTEIDDQDMETEDLEMKIDGIWQGMDQEIERMEQRTGQNRQDIEELITEFTKFTEFMKKQLDQ